MRECVIVGGGIHGTYLVQRLLEETPLERSDVLVVDPNDRLLASFRQKARACEMNALRSTFVHHIGTEPFGLEDFAEARGREDELLSRPKYPRRPSLSLFLDYTDYVIERNDLASLHRQAAVTSIRRCDSSSETQSLVLETDAGETITTRTCVLAMGHGGRYQRPSWADGIGEIEHVWDDSFDPETPAGDAIVVGGGITAAQVALCLADRVPDDADDADAAAVTLLSRHDLETAAIEADPRWINWNHVERHLHRHPPGSQARADVLREARNDATIPPTLFDRLESVAESETLSIRHGDVRSARQVDGRVRLVLENGGCCSAERVVLATGFAPVFSHPFVEQVAVELDLECGYRGMPLLSDETLAWQRADDEPSHVFVSGALAAGTVGPLAGNIAGARRAADRLSVGIESIADATRLAA
ncbi:SidA/IucD/PvdA family monooxygenase [Natronolimnobius sp. AArcel1]|uniref:FAD/NAD(P)-binding protein n=1 Tax=Natronolimnobius sp. AArcel1 TaxID=1679093 RepID=UPI0013EC4E56|nr:FAD/NAD(P)-binding protein [Natronolimnobius sp. AArcel1]NGM68451.1 SidA/IucD/PvdA family monooxygenase [Natronolimnobius sp. AArcel1]